MGIQGIKNGNTRDKEWRYPSQLYLNKKREILYFVSGKVFYSNIFTVRLCCIDKPQLNREYEG